MANPSIHICSISMSFACRLLLCHRVLLHCAYICIFYMIACTDYICVVWVHSFSITIYKSEAKSSWFFMFYVAHKHKDKVTWVGENVGKYRYLCLPVTQYTMLCRSLGIILIYVYPSEDESVLLPWYTIESSVSTVIPSKENSILPIIWRSLRVFPPLLYRV